MALLGEERLDAIRSIVNEKKSVTIQELVELLGTSESTVRRAIVTLDKQGKLKRVHGGAMAIEDRRYQTIDAAFDSRKTLNIEDKIEIAKLAASIIEPNDIVYIDAGTTTELMIDFITEKSATFVTNAIAHARKLSLKGFTTYVLGGEYKALTEAIVGEEAIMGLDRYNFTKGFFGTNGITEKNGYTTPDAKEANVKRKAMSKTRDRYILSDSTKFDEISSVTFSEFANAIIITKDVKDNYKEYVNILEVEG